MSDDALDNVAGGVEALRRGEDNEPDDDSSYDLPAGQTSMLLT